MSDVNGDIATLLTDTLIAQGSDERITEFFDAPTQSTAQQRESTYQKRWMYFYLSSVLSPYLLKGWGELGAAVNNASGGGTVRFFNNGPGANPTWELVN